MHFFKKKNPLLSWHLGSSREKQDRKVIKFYEEEKVGWGTEANWATFDWAVRESFSEEVTGA